MPVGPWLPVLMVSAVPLSQQSWAGQLQAIAANEPWALDFFAHIDRVRDYCTRRAIEFRQAAKRLLVVPAPASDALAALVERFAAETFGARAGGLFPAEDSLLEGALSDVVDESPVE